MGSTAFPKPPVSVADLMQRVEALAGHTLGDIARRHFVSIPVDLRRAKGWQGQLLEIALGATSGSKAQPDFPHLGVEMKTVPLDVRGRVLESTYVCTAPLDPVAWGDWETTWVRNKLRCVLWVPLMGQESPAERRVGMPVLWRPSANEDRELRADWEEFASLAAQGQFWQLRGTRGKVLQLRPKAARGSDGRWEVDEDGSWVQDTPRGFYLRPKFTEALLRRHLHFPETS